MERTPPSPDPTRGRRGRDPFRGRNVLTAVAVAATVATGTAIVAHSQSATGGSSQAATARSQAVLTPASASTGTDGAGQTWTQRTAQVQIAPQGTQAQVQSGSS